MSPSNPSHSKSSTYIIWGWSILLLVLCVGMFLYIQVRPSSSYRVHIPTRSSVQRAQVTTHAPKKYIEQACNGWESLCSRPMRDVAFLGSYHSSFNGFSQNQYNYQSMPIVRQLKQGVRALWFGLHSRKGHVLACIDKSCSIQRRMRPILRRIIQWSDRHPRDVLMLFFDNTLPNHAFKDILDTVHIRPRSYIHTSQQWPSLDTLRKQSRRLILFTTREVRRMPWLHWMPKYTFSTTQTFSEHASCPSLKAQNNHKLFILFHRLGGKTSPKIRAQKAHQEQSIVERSQRCKTKHSRTPNVVFVDFFNLGHAQQAVQMLNEVF